ncbi:MAG: sulfatase-like hydrolase/transferase [Verrucomicrobiales bacterium]
MNKLARRQFFKGLIATSGLGGLAGNGSFAAPQPPPAYAGPRVIIVRFGGGVRRRETIEPEHSYAPFLANELLKRGTLFSDMRISTMEGLNTSHGEGTLNILTGKYDRYESVDRAFLSERFEAKVPTLFEYLRKAYAVPEHQTLIINGEDRTQEEFYSFSNHHLFGAAFRSNVLSLYRYKAHVLRSNIASGVYAGSELVAKRKDLKKMERLDQRGGAGAIGQGTEIDAYWENWRGLYGDTGLKNPRGDRLLTELAARAIKQLRPRLMMINYNDPDYVHWGNLSHYTRGITIIDEGVRRLMDVVEADEEYRDNTIFALVPDCGRDTSPFASVPCQHHFNSVSSRRIWALFVGPGIPEGEVYDREVQQVDFAPTVAKVMGCASEHADGSVLDAAIA